MHTYYAEFSDFIFFFLQFNVVSVKGGAEGRVVTVPRVTTQGPDEPNITFAIAFTTASSGNAAPTEVTIALQACLCRSSYR